MNTVKNFRASVFTFQFSRLKNRQENQLLSLKSGGNSTCVTPEVNPLYVSHTLQTIEYCKSKHHAVLYFVKNN